MIKHRTDFSFVYTCPNCGKNDGTAEKDNYLLAHRTMRCGSCRFSWLVTRNLLHQEHLQEQALAQEAELQWLTKMMLSVLGTDNT